MAFECRLIHFSLLLQITDYGFSHHLFQCESLTLPLPLINFGGDGVSQETTINNVNILNMLHRRQMLHYFEGTLLYNK